MAARYGGLRETIRGRTPEHHSGLWPGGDPDSRVTAEALPSIADVHETRPRGHQRSSGSTVEVRPNGHLLDDWLGDISDDDWSEEATERAQRRRSSPASQEPPAPERDVWRHEEADPAARRIVAAEDRRAVIERRRLVAGLVVVVVLALAAVIAVLLLRDGDQAPVASVATSTSTTPAPGETRPSASPAGPSQSTTTPSTTPSTDSASAFTLPEGTKLQSGEGDPTLVEALQQALTKAGYDPGPADGTFGRRTEAAVVAFQEANGLSVDGRVGPETASALDSAVAGG
jgi:putative peptidoglycan binding protein